MPGKSQRVHVLFHVDLGGCTNHPQADPMLAHVASSPAAVRRYLRAIVIGPTAWWEVRVLTVDQADPRRDSRDEGKVRWFDHRARPVSEPPLGRCRAAFARQRQRERAAGEFPGREDLCPACRRERPRR